MLCYNRKKNFDTVQIHERASRPPEGIKIKRHWPFAEQRGRKNHYDLHRKKTQGTNPPSRLVHQSRERERQRQRVGGEGQGRRETEKERVEARERGKEKELERQREEKIQNVRLDKRGQVPEAGKKLYLFFLWGNFRRDMRIKIRRQTGVCFV